MYNYYDAVKSDVLEAIKNRYSLEEIAQNIIDGKDDFSEKLNDDLWIDDSVTGNASGSYTFNRYKASENLVGNYDLVREVVDEFCIEASTVVDKIDDPEYWDVSIRCYLLYNAICEALEELEDDDEIAEIIERLEAVEDEKEKE